MKEKNGVVRIIIECRNRNKIENCIRDMRLNECKLRFVDLRVSYIRREQVGGLRMRIGMDEWMDDGWMKMWVGPTVRG